MTPDATHIESSLFFPEDHPLFRDHFPGAPRVPGTLLFEALRVEAANRFPDWKIIGMKRFQFRHFVEPGEYTCSLALQPETATIRCSLFSGERCMAKGTLLLEPRRKENHEALL